MFLSCFLTSCFSYFRLKMPIDKGILGVLFVSAILFPPFKSFIDFKFVLFQFHF